mmetsp:Transcript_51609/g.81974  ORF Transcript_51609/g.81974 Transcript_51609/m.81974 type:complete len:308 (+) Transcript_51609:1250-2173(+)
MEAAATTKAARSCFASVAPVARSSASRKAALRASKAALNAVSSCSSFNACARIWTSSAFAARNSVSSASYSLCLCRSCAESSLSNAVCSLSNFNLVISRFNSTISALSSVVFTASEGAVGTNAARESRLAVTAAKSPCKHCNSVSRRRFSDSLLSKSASISSKRPFAFSFSHFSSSRSQRKSSFSASTCCTLRFFSLLSTAYSWHCCLSLASSDASRLARSSPCTRKSSASSLTSSYFAKSVSVSLCNPKTCNRNSLLAISVSVACWAAACAAILLLCSPNRVKTDGSKKSSISLRTSAKTRPTRRE